MANTVFNTVTFNTVFEHCVSSTYGNTSSVPCCAEADIQLSLDIYCAGFSCRWAFDAQSALPVHCSLSPPLKVAATRLTEGDIPASRSILSAPMSGCGLSRISLQREISVVCKWHLQSFVAIGHSLHFVPS
jgi:hypothetical protein